jgi:hypothetical protein
MTTANPSPRRAPPDDPGGTLIVLIAEAGADFRYFPEGQIDPEDGCPKFEEIRKAMGVNPSTTLEPVMIRYLNRRCTMFVDEDGLSKRLPINRRASEAAGRMIVGPAAIWIRGKRV